MNLRIKQLAWAALVLGGLWACSGSTGTSGTTSSSSSSGTSGGSTGSSGSTGGTGGDGGACALLAPAGCVGDQASGANPEAHLTLRAHVQPSEDWSWAAGIAEVSEFYTGQFANDCQLVSAFAQHQGVQVDCCASPGLCQGRNGTVETLHTLVRDVAGVANVAEQRTLSECELRQELANGRPVLVGYKVDGSTAQRMAVVVGYGPTGFDVHDPYVGATTGLPYNDLVARAHAVWTFTMHHLVSASSPRCP